MTVILGTSGFAIELCALVRAAGGEVAGFIGPQAVEGLPAPYLGSDDALASLATDAEVLVAVGAPALREKLSAQVEASGRKLGTFVSPRAFVASDAAIAPGAMVYPNATVHARVRLGLGVLVNSNASIGHETEIGAFANVGPGVSLGGGCRIGAGVYLGIGCSLLEELVIAPGAVIGAGAVVVRDIDQPGTYAGVPAKAL